MTDQQVRGAGQGPRYYQGAVAVITGGASGIGAALARALAGQGAYVVLADRQLEEAQAEAAAIRQGGGAAEAVALDVRDAAAVRGVIDEVHLTRGRIDLLFNNAGIGAAGLAESFSLDDWQEVVAVNLMGVVHGVQAALPHMLRQGFGHLVNTASMAGLLPTPHMAPYGMTKHGVVGLSRALRAELWDQGVRVTALCPGFIRTNILVDGGRFGRNTLGRSREEQLGLIEPYRPMDVDEFAAGVARRLPRNPGTIILPSRWQVAYLLDRLSKSLSDWISVLTERRLRAL